LPGIGFWNGLLPLQAYTAERQRGDVHAAIMVTPLSRAPVHR
jgi:hypothetical protein